MALLLAKIFRWIFQKLGVLLVILAVLLAAQWVKSEWQKIQEHRASAAEMRRIVVQLTDDLEPLRRDRGQLAAKLQEVAGLRAGLEQVRSATRRDYEHAVAELRRIQHGKRWYYLKITKPKYFLRVERAKLRVDLARKTMRAAQADLDELSRRISSSPEGRRFAELNAEVLTRENDIELLQKRAAAEAHEVAMRPLEKARLAILKVLPSALVVLAGVILTPLLIKSLLYFVVAPLVSRARPVRIDPTASGLVSLGSPAVSVTVAVDPGDEWVIHSSFLQAGASGPGKRTRFLFSWRMPFTSLAAQLFLMIAVSNRGERRERITIAPKRELFDLLSTVVLPLDSSMVMYPRSLVAVRVQQGKLPTISRHWRLFALHSWVTFQFRYLVIHGEAELVIRGCRGVREEPVMENQLRQHDQGATLGFTTNLAYSAVRCETFVDYLLGRDGLFNDRFSEGPGSYLTEEIPTLRNHVGIFGRGLEGLVDGLLKAFGI